MFIEYINQLIIYLKQKNISSEIIFYSSEHYFENETIFSPLLLYRYDKIFVQCDLYFIQALFSSIYRECNKNEILYSKIYFLNIEQLSHPSYYQLMIQLNKKIQVIDYSEENREYLRTHFDKTYLHPPYFLYHNIPLSEKNIDILFLNNNDYRNDKIQPFLNHFQQKGYSIFNFSGLFHQSRNQIFQKTKIFLNIHCSDNHMTMELIRIIHLLSYRVIVISFDSIYSDLLFVKKNMIVLQNNEKMIEMIDDILANYSLYYSFYESKNFFREYQNYVEHNSMEII